MFETRAMIDDWHSELWSHRPSAHSAWNSASPQAQSDLTILCDRVLEQAAGPLMETGEAPPFCVAMTETGGIRTFDSGPGLAYALRDERSHLRAVGLRGPMIVDRPPSAVGLGWVVSLHLEHATGIALQLSLPYFKWPLLGTQVKLKRISVSGAERKVFIDTGPQF